MAPVKRRYGVTSRVESCHTGVVDGYVVEGHVPADLIKRVLAERPDVVGISAPGMPQGSPGMEGPRKDRYEVVLFDKNGNVTVYAVR
ncbi:MAG TPA: DUF411 domain-containing protein [Gemmatimonadales bacterium]|nr:DUF411 domain-containing protein [Gemmatimonadales bacterium]